MVKTKFWPEGRVNGCPLGNERTMSFGGVALVAAPPTSHSRRGCGTRIKRSDSAVAERRRRLEASHWLPHLPASHSRRSYGARIGRSAYAVAERRRRLEASHWLPHLPTSHSRRSYGARIERIASVVAERRSRLELSDWLPHLPASHSRRGHGARIDKSPAGGLPACFRYALLAP